MTLSLDTNVLIDLLRKRASAVRRRYDAARLQEQPIRLSLIVWHELMYGVRCSPRPDHAHESVRLLIGGFPIEPFTEEDMLASAEIRARLRRRGEAIGAFDSLVAGQALGRGWTVVTANAREFSRVEGLAIEDWSQPN